MVWYSHLFQSFPPNSKYHQMISSMGFPGKLLHHVSCQVRNMLCLVTQLCVTVFDTMDCSLPGSSVHGDSPGKNTGVGCHALLQGIFPTQGSNPGLSLCRWILCILSHQGSPSKKHNQLNKFLLFFFEAIASLLVRVSSYKLTEVQNL